MTRSVVELQPSDARPSRGAGGAVSTRSHGAHPELHRPAGRTRGGQSRPIAALADVLAESYGIIVYQDQVLQVVRKLAGYSLGQADVLRRAMGKKEKDVMARRGPEFIDSRRSPTATRSRRAEQRLGAPAALRRLRLQQGPRLLLRAGRLPDRVSQGELSGRVHGGAACRLSGRRKIGSLRPSKSAGGMRVAGASARRECVPVGLRRSKTVSDPGSASLLSRVSAMALPKRGSSASATENGPYHSLFEFTERAKPYNLNRSSLESLIKAGALDRSTETETSFSRCLMPLSTMPKRPIKTVWRARTLCSARVRRRRANATRRL